jgi:phage-related protein
MDTFFVSLYGNISMKPKFTVLFMEDAREFLASLDDKSREKIIYNIDKASLINDKDLFKKLKGEIWEFRTLYNKTYFRLFAFWDKSDKSVTLVITTHGIVKKTDKIPESDLEKAEQIRQNYLKSKKL